MRLGRYQSSEPSKHNNDKGPIHINSKLLGKHTVTGARSHGFLMKVEVFSSLAIITGGIIIPGTAIAILDGITYTPIV